MTAIYQTNAELEAFGRQYKSVTEAYDHGYEEGRVFEQTMFWSDLFALLDRKIKQAEKANRRMQASEIKKLVAFLEYNRGGR